MSLDESLARIANFVSGWRHECALIGGLAIVARVRVRPTRDADLIVLVDEDETEALVEHARAVGFTCPDDLETWLAGGLLPLRPAEPSSATALDVDLILADDPFLESVADRAAMLRLGGVELPTATIEDLVLLKLLAGRPIDIDDVLAIKDAYEDELDADYLIRTSKHLGLKHELSIYFDFDS